MNDDIKEAEARTKWCVWTPETKRFVGSRGRVQWSYDRGKAEECARWIGGEVISADDLREKMQAASRRGDEKAWAIGQSAAAAGSVDA